MTADEYLRLRDETDESQVPCPPLVPGDLLSVLSPELNKLGISDELVLRMLHGDDTARDQLCIQLLGLIQERKKLHRDGASHSQSRGEAVTDSQIDLLLAAMLDAPFYGGVSSRKPSLAMLLRERLVGEGSMFGKRYHVEINKRRAIQICARMIELGISPTNAAVGQALGIDKTTVGRWFREGEMIQRAREEHENRKQSAEDRPTAAGLLRQTE